MKKKDRDRKKARDAKKVARATIGEACTQNGHEVFDHPELGTYDAYICSRCHDCYQCAHSIIDRAEAGCIKWYRCPDGFEKPSYMDLGQFKSLDGKPPNMKVNWSLYTK